MYNINIRTNVDWEHNYDMFLKLPFILLLLLLLLLVL